MNEYCRAGQATDDSMVQVHCMLDNLGYNYTLRINIRKMPVFFVVSMSFVPLEVVVRYSFGTSVYKMFCFFTEVLSL